MSRDTEGREPLPSTLAGAIANARHNHSLLNVNLQACHCGLDPHCQHDNTPALVPSQVPKFFQLQMRLADCDCFHRGADGRAIPPPTWEHTSTCASNPWIGRCSITTPDGSWERSEVGAVASSANDEDGHMRPLPLMARGLELALLLARQRWALVVSLMLGRSDFLNTAHGDWLTALVQGRNELFSALVAMVRAEEAAAAAQERALKCLHRRPAFVHRPRKWRPMEAPSASTLAEYAEQLVRAVGLLEQTGLSRGRSDHEVPHGERQP